MPDCVPTYWPLQRFSIDSRTQPTIYRVCSTIRPPASTHTSTPRGTPLPRPPPGQVCPFLLGITACVHSRAGVSSPLRKTSWPCPCTSSLCDWWSIYVHYIASCAALHILVLSPFLFPLCGVGSPASPAVKDLLVV